MNFHKNHWLLFSVICFGFIGLSLIVGILPAIWVQNNSEPMPGAQPMTEIVQRGIDVYVAEGCVACHTQQVRPLEMDAVWGRPSAPGDYAYVTPSSWWAPYAPAVLGSERTGPDLTNVGARQSSDVWQYMHLYNPRSVVPDSVMPAYPWLFDRVTTVPSGKTAVPVPAHFAPKDGSLVVPNEKGEALVAYLLSLKQPSLTAAPVTLEPEAAEPAPAGEPEPAGEPQAATEPEAAAEPEPAAEPQAAAEPEASEAPATPEQPEAAPAPAATPEPAAPAAAEEPAAPVTAEEPTTPAPPAAEEATTPAAEEAPISWDEELGSATYTAHCAACHQATGQGIPNAFPPLADDPVVTADDPTEHVTTVLHGKQGSTINGVTYGAAMPPFAAQLSDEEIAAVVNHERTSWGNSAPLVTPADVAALRGGGQ
ncbi:MAG: cytochrome c [Truepera sp.]|nr:cytochrome c [Truepera sp.]